MKTIDEINKEIDSIIGGPAIKLIEECNELIHAICKAERFGYNNFHPDNYPCHKKPKEEWCDYKGKGAFMGHVCGSPLNNFDDIKNEMFDVITAFGFLRDTIEGLRVVEK